MRLLIVFAFLSLAHASQTPTESPSRPVDPFAPEDPDISAWLATRAEPRPVLIYPFTQRECISLQFASRGHVKLHPKGAPVSCDGNQAGVQLVAVENSNQEQLVSERIGSVAPLLSQNYEDLQFAFETWVDYGVGGAGGGRDLHFASFPVVKTMISHYTGLIVQYASYLQYYNAVCDITDVPYEFYNGYAGLYHITQSFRTEFFSDTQYAYSYNTTITKNGVTEFCTRSGWLDVLDEGAAFTFSPTDRLQLGGKATTGNAGFYSINGTLRLVAVYNKTLSPQDVAARYLAGPPNSIPVALSGRGFDAYEDVTSLLNLSTILHYDADGDDVLYLRVTTSPSAGTLRFLNGSLAFAPLTLPLGVNLAYSPEPDAFGCLSGLSVAFSDDGARFSPVPAPILICIQEASDPPQPTIVTPVQVIKGQTLEFTLPFYDPDGDAQDPGAMRNGTRLRPGARVRFHTTHTPQAHLRNLTAEEDVQYTGAEEFRFFVVGTEVGQVNFTYLFTDPANNTGNNGTLVVNVLPALLACPVTPRTRPAHLPPCLSHEAAVYLEGYDANLPQAPISYRVLSLPRHGSLRLNGPSPSTLSVGQLFSSTLIPNVLFAAERGFYSAANESSNFRYVDLLGNPLPAPDSFVFRVERAGEEPSLNYTYVLHVPATFLPVNVSTQLAEHKKGSIAFNLSSPTEDVLYVGVMVRASVGRIRFTAPFHFYAGVNLVDEGCSWSGMAAWACSELRFISYPSRANEILQTLEFKPPAGGVNGSQELEVRVYKTGGFGGENLLGEASVSLVGDLTGTTSTQVAAIILGSIVSGALAFSLCSFYLCAIFLFRVL